MTLLRQMVCCLTLGWLAAGSPLFGAGPYSTFGRSSLYASATPVEAFLNGTANQGIAQAAIIQAQAALIKSSADAVEAVARAADIREKTRAVFLDNEMKEAKNFYEKRQLHDSFVSARGRKRATKEDLLRYSKAEAPPRAGSYAVAPGQNAIHWPDVLRSEEYADMRIELDCLFQKRQPSDGGHGSDFYHNVNQIASAMRDQLRANVDRFSPAEYIAARRFIDALVREAEVPKGVPGLAAAR